MTRLRGDAALEWLRKSLDRAAAAAETPARGALLRGKYGKKVRVCARGARSNPNAGLPPPFRSTFLLSGLLRHA